jgi:NAD(P)-dependent dehydrogenase (short-subunit alcohol dehydrogenase family)
MDEQASRIARASSLVAPIIPPLPRGSIKNQNQVRDVWLCMREEIALMLPQKRGSIVNTASVAGHTGFIGYPADTASKHAVMGLTQSCGA